MESFVFLILMFLVGGVLQTLAKRKQQQRREPRRPVSLPRSAEDEFEPEPQDLLATIRKAYEEAERGHLPRPLPDESLEEMVEESTSLEVEPEVRSIEHLEARPERVVVDQDDTVDETLARRLTWAEEHAKPISPADHQAFDQAIRAPRPRAPVGTDPAADRLAELRKMVVWREVFGPPKSLQ